MPNPITINSLDLRRRINTAVGRGVTVSDLIAFREHKRSRKTWHVGLKAGAVIVESHHVRGADEAEQLRRRYLAWLLDQPECHGIVENSLEADVVTGDMLKEQEEEGHEA